MSEKGASDHDALLVISLTVIVGFIAVVANVAII